ncbi:SPOR domain-containing protein [Fibrobacter sp. UWR3]|uniref:SPOR domain-containing protein n=1 Tax=Fibrobacter sp. UWR3 TaxID=1896217 RepID=UPI000933DDED|nr:SPOR domain-containing protein [Fibrobacter sp. UWR3]
MKMKFWNVRGIAAILFLICSTSSLAQPAANAPADSQATVTIADAQKAYVAGKWKDAARLFEQACPNEPDSVRTECYLWNVLALSQIGAAKEFSTAGKRLDSLIKKTNPQKAVYADLMMTKAQFQLYMGRNEKAAEALIHAIETSQPHQAIVLQKVCAVVQSKVKNPTLDETCKRLSEPGVDASTPTPDPTPSTGSATEQPAAVQSVTEQPATEPKAAAQPANDATTAPAAEPAKTAPADTAAKATPAPAVQPEKPVPAPAPEKEYWILQLGAFGVKSNAELLVNNLKKQGIKGTIEERVGETKTLYLVQTGKFETKEKAVDFGASKLTPLNVEFRPILKK